MNEQIHVSLDIETLSTSRNAVILSIGIATSCGKALHLFPDVQEQIDAGREVSASTLLWWFGQDGISRLAQQQASRDPVPVVRQELRDFFHTLQPYYLVWGNSPSFDCDILADFLGDKPWPFWAERDVRTIRMLVRRTEADTPHDALSDAKAQLADVVAFVRLTERGGDV